MIDEFYIQSAINIRREYLKLSNNMELYQKRAYDVVNMLEDTINKLNELQSKLNNKITPLATNDSLNELLVILKNVEDEGVRLELLVEPINKQIEKLSKDESELYSKIRNKYPDLPEAIIVESVRERLEKEGLI